MDATFTEEQQALRQAVRDLLADHCPIERVRTTWATPTDTALDLYSRLADLGVADLPGLVELGIVLEECGRALAPVPVAHTIGTAAAALAVVAPTRPLTADVRAGRAIPVVVGLDGPLTPDVGLATHVLEVTDGELVAHPADRCILRSVPTMDATRQLWTVEPGVEPEVLGPAEPAVSTARRSGCVALAHELVGLGQACLDRAVEHAKVREQFGKPIGAYQAVSHRCADMFVALETARGHAYYAAWAVDTGAADADLAASQAKATAAEAALLCAHGAIQIHGGIGFTWEHDLHLYLKRARSAAAMLGSSATHRQIVADLMGV